MKTFPKKWLITGGCGFIGRNLIKTLVQRGDCFIRVVDNLSVGTRDDLARVCEFRGLKADEISASGTESGAVHLIAGDILDEPLSKRAAVGMDVIVHLAANTGVAPSVADPRADCMANVIGTLNYLEAAREKGVSRFVFASSGAPVGECNPPIHEELAPHPVSPYGASKLAGEGYCSAYHKSFGIETVALRFGNVYGPLSGKKDSVVAKFIRRAIGGKPLHIYGDGSQTRDFIYVEDLVSAIHLAAVRPNVGGEIFQIATHAETSVQEIAAKISDAMKKRGFPSVSVEFMDERTGDVKRNFSDTTKAGEKLGWHCRMNLDKGIDQTVQWFIRNNHELHD